MPYWLGDRDRFERTVNALAEYDRGFAEALGLDIYIPSTMEIGTPPADIAMLIAGQWWDDSAWDLRIDV